LSRTEITDDDNVKIEAANINTNVLTNNKTTSNSTSSASPSGGEDIISQAKLNGECF
jgi:hypothetical protein